MEFVGYRSREVVDVGTGISLIHCKGALSVTVDLTCISLAVENYYHVLRTVGEVSLFSKDRLICCHYARIQ